MLQQTAHAVGGPQLRLRVRGRRHARRAARLRAGGPRGARVHVRALERQGLPDPRGGRGDPAADAHRPRQPRHGGDRAHLLAGARARGRRASAATAPTTRCSPTCSSSTGAEWFARLARDSTRGTPCWRSSPSRGGCWRATSSTRPSIVAADFIDLKSPYMGGHSRRCAQLAADAARVLGLPDDAIDRAPPRGARPRLRHHRRPELDLGQARRADADGVRPGRAPPDADRADAAPLARAGRAEPGRVGAPREVRRLRATTGACASIPSDLGRMRARRRPRSTSG